MKRLAYKLKKILSSRAGETLMEGVVSFLILTVLLMAVITMIKTSLSITEHALAQATGIQSAANNAVLGTGGGTARLDLALRDADSGAALGSVPIDVNLYNDGAFIAFTPVR